MEMCYDGALVMPSSYAVMDSDEMTYVEGGGVYISNSKLQYFMHCFVAAYSVAPRVVAACFTATCRAISRVVSKFTSWVGGTFGGVAGSFVGWAIGAYCGWELAKAVCTALIKQKGIYIGWGFSVR